MYDKHENYFDMLIGDIKCIISTMHRNMSADIDAGYNPAGACIRRQLADIEAYTDKWNNELDKIALMDENKINRYCYTQLVKRGAIDI